MSVSLGLDPVSSPGCAQAAAGADSCGAGMSNLVLTEEDFGFQQVSCMDLLRSGDPEPPSSFSSGAAPPQVGELYTSFSGDLYRDAPGVWCAYGRQPEPESGAGGGGCSGAGGGGRTFLRKYCECGARQECGCVWFSSRAEQSRKSDTRAAMAQSYGLMESYQSAAMAPAAFPNIKTEPSMWVDCTDRSFRCCK